MWIERKKMEKKALEMAKNGGFNLIQDGDFTYIDEGEGDVMILLHGLFGALSNFHEVINHFKKDLALYSRFCLCILFSSKIYGKRYGRPCRPTYRSFVHRTSSFLGTVWGAYCSRIWKRAFR